MLESEASLFFTQAETRHTKLAEVVPTCSDDLSVATRGLQWLTPCRVYKVPSKEKVAQEHFDLNICVPQNNLTCPMSTLLSNLDLNQSNVSNKMQYSTPNPKLCSALGGHGNNQILLN